MNKTIYHVTWDINDSRFQYANDSYWSNKKHFFIELKDWIRRNKENLQTIWKENDKADFDLSNENFRECTDFEYWIQWCINNFCYIEEIKLSD